MDCRDQSGRQPAGADRVRAALDACPFVVVSDCWPTDTTRFGHVVLPAAGWAKRTAPSPLRTSHLPSAPVPRSPGEARPDWWMFAEVARRLGFAPAFAWDGPAAVFREHAALTGFENAANGSSTLRLSPTMTRLRLLTLAGQDGSPPLGRLGRVATPSLCLPHPSPQPPPSRGGGDLVTRISPRFRWRLQHAGSPARSSRPPSPARPQPAPFLLNTGRVRDQWHTMTRTGRVPRLMMHAPEPMVALNPADAVRLAWCRRPRPDRDRHRQRVLRVTVTEAQRPASCSCRCTGPMPSVPAGPIGRAVTARLDPHSGQPELKATPASISPAPPVSMACCCGGPRALTALCHWADPLPNGQLYHLTGDSFPPATTSTSSPPPCSDRCQAPPSMSSGRRGARRAAPCRTC